MLQAIPDRLQFGFVEKTHPRTAQVVESLTRHLHAFVKEVEATHEEWLAGIRFLTETGYMCTEWRHEFILLSDILGVPMLVDAINNRRPSGVPHSRAFLRPEPADARERR
ncbi:dioxygenase [Sinorhizobium fredii]|uniref:dioxygenase n=1 Tax=Rhizobium fredii TaxID=380 RepID=UPI0026B9972F